MSALKLATFLQPNVVSPPEYYEGTQFRWGKVVFRPAEFKQEGLFLLFVISYIVLWRVGKQINKSKARKWLDAHLPLYETQFSRPTSVSGDVIQDGGCDLYNFSTGRRGVSSLHTVFSLLPRHDIFQSIIDLGRQLIELDYRPYDKIVLDFTIHPSASLPNFVWAVVDKDDVKAFRQYRYDITFTKTSDSPALPSQYTVFSEVADVTETILKQNPFVSLAQVLKDPVKSRYFRSLVVSDLPLDAPETAISLTEQPKHVVLTLQMPSDPQETVALVKDVFAFVDYLASKQFTLRPETKPKLKKIRTDMEDFLKRQDQKEDADTLEKKRADKRKAEEERIAKLSAAEQKKHEERERKRNLRKAQTKGAIRSRAG